MLLKLINKKEVANQIKELRFKPDKKVDFMPGQFLMFKHNINGKMEKRAYSIASSPLSAHIGVILKIYPDGKMSKIFEKLKIDDSIEADGPFGVFKYDNQHKNVVLLAGGTGIAPFMGFIRYIIEKKHDANIILIYSCKTESDIICYEELKNFQKNNIKVVITLTQQKDNWTGHKGRISKELIIDNVHDINDYVFYLCGPNEMTDYTYKLLNSDLGIDKSRIKRESWG